MKRKVKPVVWILCGLAVAAGISALLANLCRRSAVDDAEPDGGVITHYDGDVSKEIASTEIVAFSCELSLLSFDEPEAFCGNVYRLEASLQNGAVSGQWERYDRFGAQMSDTFQSDVSFMEQLYGIVSDYGFAQYNGYYHKVSGLPEMYGVRLDIRYASGESVNAYDNQDVFLPLDAVTELIALFTSQEGTSA